MTPILDNLNSHPRAKKHDKYRWCDYIEIRCITSTDKLFSRCEFAKSIFESWNEIDEDSIYEQEEDQSYQTDDRTEAFAAECFKFLRHRQLQFTQNWPFEIDHAAEEIKLKESLEPIHDLYINLLLSSLLQYCPKNRRQEITDQFERASMAIFKNLLPRDSKTYFFGASIGNHYTGSLHDKLKLLAKDINGTLALRHEHFRAHNSGDGGIDLVGWHNLGDTRQGIPIAFAQCGCSPTDWPAKMLSASPSKLKNLRVLHPWANYYFMPHDLSTIIDNQLDWHQLSDISECIVIDRLRLINLCISYELDPLDLIATPAVQEAKQICC